MEIKRFDVRHGTSRVVFHNGVAYFTGHVAAGKQATLREQTLAVCARYDELFEKFGLKKENILMNNSYISDMSMIDEFSEVFHDWVGGETPPAGVAVEAKMSSPEYLLEMALIVAVE